MYQVWTVVFLIIIRIFLENIKRKKIKVIFVVGENKINYIDRLFMKKDCISKKQLNEISFKLDITNCKEAV